MSHKEFVMEKRKMKKSIISMLLVFAVLAFLVSCGGSEPGSIFGTVTDKVTGEPVKNAFVELSDEVLGGPVKQKIVTGSDGMFEFSDISSGDCYLWVRKAGYFETFESIHVESGKKVHMDFLLEKYVYRSQK